MLRKYVLRFLKSKPRRSLCRLRLKFVQTTRVVCADFAEVLTLGNARFVQGKLIKIIKCID